jgi:diguanylate cyclase (GGDEF)-like protein
VLSRFALICREQLRTEDVLARYWADKFICLLPAADVHSAEAVAERVRTRAGAVPVPTEETAVPVRVSAGVASQQEADRSLDTLIRRAERAVRLAKEQGGDRVHTER